MSFFKKLLSVTTGRDALQGFVPERNAFATQMLGARPEAFYGSGEYAGDFLGGDREGAATWDRRNMSEVEPAFVASLSPERRAAYESAKAERTSTVSSSNALSKMLSLAAISAAAGGAGMEAFGAGGFNGFGPSGNEASLGLDFSVTPNGVVDSAGNAAFGNGGFSDSFASGAFGGYNNPDFTGGYGNFGGSGVFNNPDFVSIPGNAGGAEFGYVGAGMAPASGFSNFMENPMSFLANQAFGLGNIGFNVPTARTLAGLYGLYESKRLRKLTKLPDPSDIVGMPGYQAGLEAVRRSMASQGYQGSGNMMLALQKYGGDFYNQYVNQRMNSAMAGSGPATGALSSLALLSGGLGGLYGR